MRIYYIIATLSSIGLITASYLGYPVHEISSLTAEWGLGLLWFVLLIKPLTIILSPCTEVKVIKKEPIVDYIKACKIRTVNGLKDLIFTILRLISAFAMKYRRLIGITVFLLIFTHFGIYFADRLNIGYGFTTQIQAPYLVVGYIGLILLLVGYLTSNNLSIKLLKTNRKPVQYTAYGALVFAVAHLMLFNPGEYRGHVVLLVIYIYLKLVEKGKMKFIFK